MGPCDFLCSNLCSERCPYAFPCTCPASFPIRRIGMRFFVELPFHISSRRRWFPSLSMSLGVQGSWLDLIGLSSERRTSGSISVSKRPPAGFFDSSFRLKGDGMLKYRFLFEFILCLLRTGCDVVVNRCAVCLSLLRGKDDSLFFFFNALSFLRQRVSRCLLDGRRIPVWK